MLSKDIFDPNYGLFKLSSNKVSIYPSPLSFLIPNQLQEFRMAGRLLGKALIGNQFILKKLSNLKKKNNKKKQKTGILKSHSQNPF